MFASAWYRKSPLALQEWMLSARGQVRRSIREGARFRRAFREVQRTQWYGRAELEALRLARLRGVLAHAIRNVPYYAAVLGEAGIRPEDIRTAADVTRIPDLDKATVVANWKNLVAANVRGPRLSIHSSGSTGAPLRVLQTIESAVWEHAFVWRQLGWAGYRSRERRAWIRGDMIVPIEQDRPPFWRLDRLERTLMMSSYHLAPGTVEGYVAALEAFDPAVIQAYPSSIGYLARYLAARGRRYRGRALRAAITSSETLAETDRQAIRDWMGCEVYDHYGAAERVALIQSCEHARYHVASDYAFTELRPLGSGRYEIIGTGFYNPLMPLIRYRMEDVVEIDPSEGDCPCGRAFPVVKRIAGRADDCVRTRDGRYIGRLDHIFKGIRNIAASQIVQDRIEEIVIRVVPLAGFDDAERRKLAGQARTRLGADIGIRIETVADIPRSRNAKLRAVVCNLPDRGNAGARAPTGGEGRDGPPAEAGTGG